MTWSLKSNTEKKRVSQREMPERKYGDIQSMRGTRSATVGGRYGNPLQYSCLEIPHGQRSLGAYSPWGHKEPDMTELLSTAQHSN